MRTRISVVAVALATAAVLAGGGSALADSGAQGAAAGPPGGVSGNRAQVPSQAPSNPCGDVAEIAGVLNPALVAQCNNLSDQAGAW
ncbi:chaplin [Streptomyces sp. NPDC002932]|uniref:chaplin n=1 Tax=Streptomyces sp. NPDC002932 TaxID=3364672 RepID=UPI0036B2AA1C